MFLLTSFPQGKPFFTSARTHFGSRLFLPLSLLCALWFVCRPVLVVAERVAIFPCTDLTAIRWVRDRHRCDVYFICRYGQPLAMPACPQGQVWSQAAHNCVPESSRWNDCPVTTEDRRATGVYTVYKVHERRKLTQPFPEGHEITYGNMKPSRGKGSLRGDKDFWRNLMMPVDQMTTRERVRSSSTITPSNEAVYYDFWGNRLTTASPPQSEKNFPHSIVTPDFRFGHRRDNSDWNNRKDTLHVDLPNQKDTSRDSKSPWYSRVAPDNKPDIRDELFDRMDFSYYLEDNPCRGEQEGLFPHPRNCHWYYNCSSTSQADLSGDQSSTDRYIDDPASLHSGLTSARYQQTLARSRAGGEDFILMDPTRVGQEGPLVWECRYPQLFDQVTGRCREFINVKCLRRFEPYDQCEYTARQCPTGNRNCMPCKERFGECRGRENGVYPLQDPRSWSPVFITCYLQRNIARDECRPPKPVFSPDKLDCVSLFEVPKQHDGFQPDCTARLDGYYPDEQGRCAIFFRCALGHFRGYDECPPGSVFDPEQLICETYSEAPQPCGLGQGPRCAGRMDGLFADPYGRCIHYFECQGGEFQQYYTCDLGIYDPLTHRCVVAAELTMRPCGLQPSPCEALPTGLYPDQDTGCQYFIECYNGILLSNSTCPPGTVFSALTGRCDNPALAPPPCGTSDICLGRPDGRYPAEIRGCSFFYECQHGQFTSLRRCTVDDGGYFFNPESGQCDYPQNICPPCGYRWWGCSRTYTRQQDG